MSQVENKARERLWSLLQVGAYADCLELARTILKVRPEDWNARMFEGNSLLGLEDFPGAIQAFDKCLRLEPDLFPARACRGEAYFKNKEYANALADLEESLKYTQGPYSYQIASVCLRELGQKDKSYEYIDMALKNNADGNAYAQKALFLERDEHYIDALKYYRQAAKMLPGDKFVQDKIAEIIDLCRPPTVDREKFMKKFSDRTKKYPGI